MLYFEPVKDLISLCILAMDFTIIWFILSMELEDFNEIFFKYHPSHSIRASGTASAAFTSGSAINSLLCLLTWLQIELQRSLLKGFRGVWSRLRNLYVSEVSITLQQNDRNNLRIRTLRFIIHTRVEHPKRKRPIRFCLTNIFVVK